MYVYNKWYTLYMKISYPLNLPFHISQLWGENPDYYSKLGMNGHNGIDFAVPIGTPVYACHDGVIQFTGIDSVRSLTVCIDTNDGTLRTLYCHLSESKVTLGQKVKRGELIALSGNTGSFTTGPHLHLGTRPLNPVNMHNGMNGAVNPFNYLDGTYPNTVIKEEVKLPEHFIAFQEALKTFQEKEGIKPYPLVGNLTKKALNKYLTIKY